MEEDGGVEGALSSTLLTWMLDGLDFLETTDEQIRERKDQSYGSLRTIEYGYRLTINRKFEFFRPSTVKTVNNDKGVYMYEPFCLGLGYYQYSIYSQL